MWSLLLGLAATFGTLRFLSAGRHLRGRHADQPFDDSAKRTEAILRTAWLTIAFGTAHEVVQSLAWFAWATFGAAFWPGDGVAGGANWNNSAVVTAAVAAVWGMYVPVFTNGAERTGDWTDGVEIWRWGFLRNLTQSLNTKFISHTKFKPDKPYLLLAFPHGVMPWGGFLNLMCIKKGEARAARRDTEVSNDASPKHKGAKGGNNAGSDKRRPNSTDIADEAEPKLDVRDNRGYDDAGVCMSTVFPETRVHLAVLSSFFYIPFWREAILWTGLVDVSRHNIRGMLRAGKTLVVFPGGAREALYPLSPPACLKSASRGGLQAAGKYDKKKKWTGEDNPNQVVLHRREAAFKIALEEGITIVPVFTFGEGDLQPVFNAMDKGSGGGLIGSFFRETLGFVPVLPVGKPTTNGLTTVVGEAIDVKKTANPTEKDVRQLQDEFRGELVQLVEKYREKYGGGPLMIRE